MPWESGLEVIKKHKEETATNAIPVLFLTGVSEVDAKLKGCWGTTAYPKRAKAFSPNTCLLWAFVMADLSISA